LTESRGARIATDFLAELIAALPFVAELVAAALVVVVVDGPASCKSYKTFLFVSDGGSNKPSILCLYEACKLGRSLSIEYDKNELELTNLKKLPLLTFAPLNGYTGSSFT
jgi:hypothetical protein